MQWIKDLIDLVVDLAGRALNSPPPRAPSDLRSPRLPSKRERERAEAVMRAHESAEASGAVNDNDWQTNWHVVDMRSAQQDTAWLIVALAMLFVLVRSVA